jgi:hypothetical protein
MLQNFRDTDSSCKEQYRKVNFFANFITHLCMSRNVRSGLISKRGPSRTASHVIRSSETTATDCPSKNCGEVHRSSPHTGSGATWEASHCRKGLSSQSQFTGLPTQRCNVISDQHSSFYHVRIWKEAVVAKYQAFYESNYTYWRVYMNSCCETWVREEGGVGVK